MPLFGDVARKVYGSGIIGSGRRARINLKLVETMKNLIILLWPDKSLHPNSRPHWAQKAKAAKAARERAGWVTKAAKWKVTGDGTVMLKITFRPPDKRKRDLDGMLSSCKAYNDGIADALGINDNRFRFTLDIGEPVKGGQVCVEIDG